MKNNKKILTLAAIIIAAIVNIFIYWNAHLYYQAKNRAKDSEKKIKTLQGANHIHRYNSLVYYELGAAYYELGINNLSDINVSEDYFQRAIQNLIYSIRLNPGSYKSHFYLAQSLLYKNYFSPADEWDYLREFKNAALLTTHNRQVFFETGKFFLFRWPTLDFEDKDFTTDVLRKSLENKDRRKLNEFFLIWETNALDYDIMGKILPEDPEIYRLYAQFLGERSLSIEERKKAIAQAESLEFKRAEKELILGQNEFQLFRFNPAFHHFSTSLNLLNKIRFYKKFTDLIKVNELRKAVILNLGKCSIELNRDLEKAYKHLTSYIILEDKKEPLKKLESYLVKRNLITEKLSSRFDDVSLFSLKLLLYFKQKKFREIIDIGGNLHKNLLSIHESRKKDFMKILHIIGDSYHKTGLNYDSIELYKRVLEIEPNNLDSLFKLKKIYIRLNKDEETQEIDNRIKELQGPKEIIFENPLIPKDQPLSLTFTFEEGQNIKYSLYFQREGEEDLFLISIFFNNRIIWENYLKDEALHIAVNSLPGSNILQILPINKAILLKKLRYDFQ